MSERYHEGMSKLLGWMQEVLYPNRCPICMNILKTSERRVCKECKIKLPYIKDNRCMKCGKQLSTEENEFCLDCVKKNHFYKQGIALWSYHKEVKQSVYRFKYKNKRKYAQIYANEIYVRYGKLIKSWDVDAIIPIPLYVKKQKKRGYNQAEELAIELGRLLGIKICSDLLVRTRNTSPQKQLNDIERQKNLKNAFKLSRDDVKLKKIILIDDIYTTGSTADEASRKFVSAGVQDIYLVSLCIGKGY